MRREILGYSTLTVLGEQARWLGVQDIWLRCELGGELGRCVVPEGLRLADILCLLSQVEVIVDTVVDWDDLLDLAQFLLNVIL